VDTWTRRKFLTMSGVTAATALAAGATLYSIDDLLNSGSEDGDSESSVLVLVTLYGGNDGLNTLVPAWDKAYQDARPDLAYSEEEVLPLDEELGLNPGMKGFKKLWDEKRLAVVRGVSYPRPDRSHFRSMSIWQTGSPSHPLPSGWLGRWLDAAENPDPLRAVSIGATLPPLLAGEKTAGAAVQLGGLTLPDPWRVVCKELAQPQDGVHPLQARAAASLSDLTKVAAEFGTEGGKSKDGKYGKNGGKGKGGKNKDGEGKGEESQSLATATETTAPPLAVRVNSARSSTSWRRPSPRERRPAPTASASAASTPMRTRRTPSRGFWVNSTATSARSWRRYARRRPGSASSWPSTRSSAAA
jgi:hypothetical protein